MFMGREVDAEWKNENPLADELVVLELMMGQRNDRTCRWLRIDSLGDPPHIEVQHFAGGPTGDECSGSTRYLLDEVLARRLIRDGYFTKGTRFDAHDKRHWSINDWGCLRKYDLSRAKELVHRRFRRGLKLSCFGTFPYQDKRRSTDPLTRERAIVFFDDTGVAYYVIGLNEVRSTKYGFANNGYATSEDIERTGIL